MCLMGLTISVELLNTLLLFVTLTFSGLWLCHHTKVNLGDPKLKILNTFWLLKVVITLFLLYIGWIPQLDPSSVSWGYDPQRFYIDAWDLVNNGWNPLAGSNYQGVIFYYGAIFYLLGHNPVIPALINAFVTLLCTLFLIRFIYSALPNRTAKDWTISGLLLVPEVLWYDVMTARETLMASLIIFAVLGVGRYLVGTKNVGLTKTIILSGTAFFAILFVRTSMAIPVVASVLVIMLFLRSKHNIGSLKKVFLIVLTIAGMLAGPYLQNLAGGSKVDYLLALNRVQSFSGDVAPLSWSKNSIGSLLIPKNSLQDLFYLPPRMVLYLAAPLPNIAVSLNGLINSSWVAWQHFMTLSTSLLMMLGFPFVLAGVQQAWRFRKRQPAPMILYITFWIIFMAVAGGNFIIHQRYRIMFSLLFFCCVWYGYTRSKKSQVIDWLFFWFVMLFILFSIFSIYKFLY